MPDAFASSADHVSAPARRCVPVTPHDTNPLSDVAKALYVGGGGTVVVQGVGGGSDAVFTRVPDGSVLPVRAAYVRATGTTASDIVALV
jgi:hypothetical protein